MLVHSWESRACHRNKMTCGSGMLNACIYGFSINDDNNSWHRYVGPFSSVAGLHVHVCQAVIHPPADESEGVLAGALGTVYGVLEPYHSSPTRHAPVTSLYIGQRKPGVLS